MRPVSNSELEALAPDDVLSSRYRIEALLGQGGAAFVYRARDARSGQRVALKQLRLAGSRHDAMLTTLFEREYHTLCQLAHPCIIEVYDYAVDAGRPYYTMELLDGEDLYERGRLPFREVCALVGDVASSLAVLHSRGRVHRDVSPRNVRCTRDQRAKLIDFGAMAPMGVSQPLVGTPPFVPPEAVQLQALDGRVDLYALGALLYFMLTGRNAYPAHNFTQLRDLWRSAPPTPRQYDPELPEALDRLVMELLQLERAARPRSAAEVMERLAGIAGRPLQELPAVSRAYLTAPVLVGREAPLQQVREGLVNALQGHGSTTLIEGHPGLGRSRMLDAGVLEAKLLGAVVLRANSTPGKRGQDYQLVRSLCDQLLAAVPVLVEQSAQPRRALLSHVIAELAQGSDAPAQPPPRRQLQAALRDFFLAITREQHVVIAVDDVERADESSTALLGMLAHGAARRKLSLLLTTVPEADPSAAMSLLRQTARSLTLDPLHAEHTHALVTSLFGEVEHAAALAERIHNLAEGNPRWVMALCERLVEHGVARYQSGRWTLPAEIDPELVPNSLASEFTARIAALSADARALGEILALTDPGALSLPDYALLSQHGEGGRTYRALDELATAAVLICSEERYQFSQPEFARLLREGVTPERARDLHARLASALGGREHVAQYAQHLLLAGNLPDAVEAALPAFAASLIHWDRRVSTLLMRTLVAAQEQPLGQLRPRLRAEATFALLITAVRLGELERFLHCLPAVLERLQLDSGLLDFAALADGAAEDRMQAALVRAAERYAATPEAQRVYSLQETIPRLIGLSRSVQGMASIAQDLSLLERMPSLGPLVSVSPLIAITERQVEIQQAMLSGCFERARALVGAQLERISGSDRAGLDPETRQSLKLDMLYLDGMLQASAGVDVRPELLAQLEQTSGYRGHAWRVRMSSELMQCNFEAARACERRAGLISLQDGGMLPGTTVRAELLCHLNADDLSGVHGILGRTQELVDRYPGWRPTHAIARCHYLRLQGDLEGALLALQPAIEIARAGRHIEWEETVRSHTRVLLALGRTQEALQVIEHALDEPADSDYPVSAPTLAIHAEALLRAGKVEDARECVEALIADFARRGARGMHLGLAYETRARVAIACRDTAGLHHAAERCAQEWKVGNNSPMNARYERLLREAHAAGLALPASAQWVATQAAPVAPALSKTLYSRMLTCIGPRERAREVLHLMIDESRARSGYLFGLRGGKLQLIAKVDESEAPPELAQTLERYLRNELELQEAPSDGATTGAGSALQPWVDAWSREFEPVLLVGRYEGERTIAGVAALQLPEFDRAPLSGELLQALTDALLAEDIIDPITCMS